MRTVLVIGVGLGEPQHLTLQAIDALNRVDAFLVVEKGAGADDLAAVRRALCERFATTRPYRMLGVPDPERDRTWADYTGAVRDWTAARAAAFGAVLREQVPDGHCAGLLAWGDPAFYDSTLRVLDALQAGGDLDLLVEVVPGISSIQLLAAAHRISLTGVGRALQITTGRRLLSEGMPPSGDAVVMLDGQLAWRHLEPAGLHIFWGANLGSQQPALVAGPLSEVSDEIVERRAEAKSRRGWVMDIYLLRRSHE